MKNNQKRKYYIKDKIVYILNENLTKNYLLRLSPPFKDGKDRRYFLSNENELKNFENISLQKAQENINKAWREIEEEWEFNGKTYKVLDYELSKSTYHNTVGNKCKVENDNNSVYFLCYHQGKVYLLMFYGGSERVCLYKYSVVNNKIYVGDFIKWTSAKNCKIIYEVVNNIKLKMV